MKYHIYNHITPERALIVDETGYTIGTYSAESDTVELRGSIYAEELPELVRIVEVIRADIYAHGATIDGQAVEVYS